MNRSSWLIFLFLLSNYCLTAENPSFHKVPARKGDSIFSLLKRYRLENHQCNFNQFYTLNKLDREAYLMEGQKYFLPVFIYRYNGKTIRSTVGIETWEQALRIKEYNDVLLRENLRQKSIVASNILWVPYHELHCPEEYIQLPEAVLTDHLIEEPIPVEEANNASSMASRPFTFAETDETFTVETVEEGLPVRRVYYKTKNVARGRNGDRHFAIFGPEHAYVPLLDKALEGKVFYVVSGHGGPDSGAIGKVGKQRLYEDEYAYDVALRLVRELIKHGATAYMITRDPDDGIRSDKYLPHDSDEYCWGNLQIPRSQKKRLYQRSDMVNALYRKHLKQGVTDQRLIAIHVDSRSLREQTDLFFYYYPDSQQGKKLAKQVHKAIEDKYNQLRPGRGYSGSVTGRDLHMLRETPVTAIYVELANIRNSYDRQRIIPERNRQLLAEWLYEGLIK